MRKLLCAMSVVALVLVAPADAKAASAVGSFSVPNVTVNGAQPTPADTCLISLTATFSFTGTLRGAFTAPFAISHDGPCSEPAAEAFLAHGTFSGEVVLDGATRRGTFDFVFGGTIDPASNARGTLVVLRGPGGLRGLRGALVLTGISGVGGTYRGALSI